MCDTFHMCDLCFLCHKHPSLLQILFVKMQSKNIFEIVLSFSNS